MDPYYLKEPYFHLTMVGTGAILEEPNEKVTN